MTSSKSRLSRTLALLLLLACGLDPSSADSTRSRSKPATIYIVGEESTLSEISLRLYGKARFWKEIAEWNHLSPPYFIQDGQRLVIQKAPLLTAEEGKAKLLDLWRNRLATAESNVENDDEWIPPVQTPPTPQPFVSAVPFTAVPFIAHKEQEYITTPDGIVPLEATQELKIEEVAQRFESKKINTGRTFDGVFSAAKSHFDSKNWEAAAAGMSQARQLNPESTPAWFMEIRALQQLNRIEEAKLAAQSLCALKPPLCALPWIKKVFNNE